MNEYVRIQHPIASTRSDNIPAVRFRTACLADGPAIWELVEGSGTLDANSRYCYLLLCRDFAETCVVASRGEEIVGFVTAYRPPERDAAVFVWQIGVAQSARRQGLAKRLLRELLSLPACRAARFLEATVTPTNAASRRLFQSLAEGLGVACHIEPGFSAEIFGAGGHEEEELFRIGPLADSPKECNST